MGIPGDTSIERHRLVANAPPAPGPSYFSRMSGPWRVVGFRWYWMASFTQSVAQGMQFLVLIWLVLELTGSSIQLTGLMVFLYGIPNTAMLPFGGVIADRMNRKYLLIATQAGVGALIGAMAILTLAEVVAVWHIYLAVALLGVLQALNQPARVTTLSDLVGQASLLDAIAQFNAAVHIGRIVGPPLVGILIDGVPLIADRFDVWGIGTGLMANAAFYGASVVFLLPIAWRSSAAAPVREPLLRNFINGLSIIKNTPVLLTVIVLSCSFGGFGMSHLQVVPVFAKDQLGSDATAAGVMLLASGVGSLVGNVALTFMHREWLYRWLLACLVTMAVVLTAFGWSTSFWVAWSLFLVLGIVSLGTVWPLSTTILQMASPSEVRGRVMGILHFTPGFHYLGALPLAFVAAATGWSLAMTGAAALMLLVTFWFGLGRGAGRELASRPTSSAATVA